MQNASSHPSLHQKAGLKHYHTAHMLYFPSFVPFLSLLYHFPRSASCSASSLVFLVFAQPISQHACRPESTAVSLRRGGKAKCHFGSASTRVRCRPAARTIASTAGPAERQGPAAQGTRDRSPCGIQRPSVLSDPGTPERGVRSQAVLGLTLLTRTPQHRE